MIKGKGTSTKKNRKFLNYVTRNLVLVFPSLKEIILLKFELFR